MLRAMPFRIEVFPVLQDTEAALLSRKLAAHGLACAQTAAVYQSDFPLNADEQRTLAQRLTNPVSHRAAVLPHDFDHHPAHALEWDWCVEIGFLPGVTDNVAHTARELAEDLFRRAFPEDASMHSARLWLLQGGDRKAVETAVGEHMNPLIQYVRIASRADLDRVDLKAEFETLTLPKVRLSGGGSCIDVNLQVDDEALATIGKKGIPNGDGTYRGPLGLSLDYLKAIRDYFYTVAKRHPRDIELETLAQTWSEHCKHTIFASQLDEITDGIYRHYIKRATNDVRRQKGNQDFCVSVFSDNSGGIVFDDEWLITDKVETHNSPSALDPFGGAITGIVGVNRDTVGFGKGAKPVLNRYGFCFADPRSHPEYYRDAGRTNPMLPPRFIMDGVIAGVNHGGNCSGIPTPQGFLYFDERFAGKPLVFVGTVGLIPREINGEPSHVKGARPGDVIVMAGGRVGKDGIHGATFSSEALDEGSPATAVQIGDPITQKKLSDAIVKEARGLGLYHAITDNGAGGLSSSVGEMAESSGGFMVDLEKIPLKYPGLDPWEIWISESQERMTLAIPPENVDAFIALMARRGVEATAIGTFTDSGRAVVRHRGNVLMDMQMAFLHDGLPPKMQISRAAAETHAEPHISEPEEYGEAVLGMLGRLNICGKSFVATQYDHEVQGTSVTKPLQGKGRVYAEASVIRPVLTSRKAAVTAQGLCPRLSDIDAYHMAANAIDMAVRNAVAIGVNPNHLALLDNFCWCSPEEPERLHQLKRAAEACYDYAVAYGTPFISGKDSMYNDFKGFDANGKPVLISIPPTLLVSALGVMDDLEQATTLDAKVPGDVVYLLGETHAELGGSEYYAHHGHVGHAAPVVDAASARNRYETLHRAIASGWVASGIAVNFGGLATALAKTAIGGQLGLEIDLDFADRLRTDALLFSESASRILVTVAPSHVQDFEQAFAGQPIQRLGTVMANGRFVLRRGGIVLADLAVEALTHAYHAPLEGY